MSVGGRSGDKGLAHNKGGDGRGSSIGLAAGGPVETHHTHAPCPRKLAGRRLLTRSCIRRGRAFVRHGGHDRTWRRKGRKPRQGAVASPWPGAPQGQEQKPAAGEQGERMSCRREAERQGTRGDPPACVHRWGREITHRAYFE